MYQFATSTPLLRRFIAFGHHAGWTMLTGVLMQGMLLVSGILVARILGVENRGHLALISLAPLILSQVVPIGLPLALTYEISKAPGSQTVLVRRVAKLLVPLALFAIAIHLTIILIFIRDSGIRVAALLTLLATAGWISQVLGLAILQGRQRFGAFNLLRGLQITLYASMAIAVMVSGTHSLVVVAGVWSLAFGVSGTASLLIALRSPRTPTVIADKGMSLRKMTQFGIKSMPAYVSPLESFRIDQLVLGIAAGPTVLGYYVVAYSLSNLPRIIAQSIGMVAYPKVAGATGGHIAIATRYVLLTVVVCGAIVGGLEVLSGNLIHLFYGAQFAASAGITRILLIAALLLSLKRVLNDCARGLGKPELGLAAEFAGWLPLIPGLLLLGATANGVAWTLVASSLTGATVLGVLFAVARRSISHSLALAAQLPEAA